MMRIYTQLTTNRSVSREMDAWRNLEKGIGKLKAAMSEMRRISV
jgi:hypothetical protein